MCAKDCVVGVGVPVWNEASSLRESLRSVQNQTFSRLRIFVSDNASDDASAKIAQDAALADSRIHVDLQHRKISQVDNFKHTFHAARGQCCRFMWLGAHDLIPPNYITDLVSLLKNVTYGLAVPAMSVSISEPESADMRETPSQMKDFWDRQNSASNQLLRMDDGAFADKASQLRTIVDRLNDCTPLHGVWTTALLKSVTFLDVAAADHAVLLQAAAHAQIFRGENVIYARGGSPSHLTMSKPLRYRVNGVQTGFGAPMRLASLSARAATVPGLPSLPQLRLRIFIFVVTLLRLSHNTANGRVAQMVRRRGLRLVRRSGI